MKKIAFGYKMGVGKDTACSYLINKYGGKHVSFAQPLYNILKYAQSTCGFKHDKDRKFLQYIGTEWAREKDPDVWVRLAMENVSENSNTYISDLRFLNEFNTLKKDGWICVKIVREQQDSDRIGTGSNKHVSETELDNIPDDCWDVIINNTGKIDDFYTELEMLV